MARTLAQWAMRQRKKSKSLPEGKKSTMTKQRIQKLNKIGSVRSIVDDWSPRLKELENFQKENGHCRVPGLRIEDSGYYPLACWVARQRQQYKRLRENKTGFIITEERIQKLNDIGFEWFLHQVKPWDRRFEELKAFQKEHGHCRVPISTGKDGDTNQLYHWVRNQQNYDNDRLMSEERIHKLNDIGFEWFLRQVKPWDRTFEKLKAFKKEHGHCRVTRGQGLDRANNQLAEWVKRQRAQYKLLLRGKQSHMKEERIQKLNEIGMVWASHRTGMRDSNS
jgi:hypothetical protein